MAQQAGDEVPPHRGQMVFRARVVEGIGVTLEERHVSMHAGPGMFGEWLRHEGRVNALRQRNFLHHNAEGHQVVRG